VTKAVLDTQVWLDWLVFDDPGMALVRAAHGSGALQIVLEEACDAELERVLAYSLGKWTLEPDGRSACLAEARRIAQPFVKAATESEVRLPKCRDPDDQKFLEAALAAGADYLITKDQALLELARRPLPFRILRPEAFQIGA
jgi:putative PIN family toxin of toxin-antitoxin system